jgi:hypothetical protein
MGPFSRKPVQEAAPPAGETPGIPGVAVAWIADQMVVGVRVVAALLFGPVPGTAEARALTE